eukprot:scaffold57385_cov65-Phaeocystis_antarctica.AAC.2
MQPVAPCDTASTTGCATSLYTAAWSSAGVSTRSTSNCTGSAGAAPPAPPSRSAPSQISRRAASVLTVGSPSPLLGGRSRTKTRTRWSSPPLGEGSRDWRGLGAREGSVDVPRRDSGGRRAGSIARAAAAFSSPFGEARGEGAGERVRLGEPGRAGVDEPGRAGVGEPGRAARGGEPRRSDGTLEAMSTTRTARACVLDPAGTRRLQGVSCRHTPIFHEGHHVHSWAPCWQIRAGRVNS